MEILVKRGCGLDVHQGTVVACLLVSQRGTRARKQIRTFSTMTQSLIELRDWLCAEGCTHIAMESTGIYWKPIYNILEGYFQIIVSNARHIKAVPGRKTDVKDSEWLADLLRHGLLRPSFVPPRPIRHLRDLLRYRRKLIESQSRERNRLLKLLESANIKLSSVATDVFGVSGRLMIEALRDGQNSVSEMADLAKGRLRNKLAELELALDGRLETHHRQLLGLQLQRLDKLEGDILELDSQLQVKLQPYTRQIALLDSIPGINWVAAATIIAEIGVDMSVFATAAHLSSWAGLSPGQNESAGKRRNCRIGPGNPYLRTLLVESALAAIREKGNYLREKFYRLKARRQHKRAIIAIAHKLLIAVYHVLAEEKPYRELGAGYLDRLTPQRIKLNLVHRLERLGYSVHLEPKSA